MPSTAIRSFQYDPQHSRLEVTFVTGRRYAYFEVPPEEYANFAAAFSKGRYFNAHIRHYPYRQLRRGEDIGT